MKFTLEGHKFFPYVAWALVIGFVLFTYSLTIELTESSSELSKRKEATVSALQNGIE